MRPIPDDRSLAFEFTRLVPGPPAAAFRAFADPAHRARWWGSECATVLESVPGERIVFADALGPSWVPGERAFAVAALTFTDERGQTRVTLTARHISLRS